jgi:hypothetical protein
MKTFAHLLSLTLAGPALLIASGAPAAPMTSDCGVAATRAIPDRTIDISSSPRSVQVTNGETVRFEVDGKTFNCTFETLAHETVLDLATIAPSGLHLQGVRVYVAPDPQYYQG